ncbi:hypothetical protein [Paenibacillus rhizophilus]|uniref:Type II secretion system protein GspF domain-containing protein n=1 Tax=Paenibacillus rhizophilus TaxID=1850366 RepID=A0A3N9P8Q8_9BACL|nr:hypothetical protein [Paenibacillus rhizophilus]RQW12025.1 hypothetical protein EH198_10275 [Paenibacillus rhizophilus]
MNGVFYLLRFVLHLLIVWGIWLLVKPLTEQGIRHFAAKINYLFISRRKILGRKAGGIPRYVPFYNHLDNLLYIAKRNYEPGTTVLRFMVQSGLLAAAVFLSGLLTLRELPGHLDFHNPFLEGVSFDSGRPWRDGWRLPMFLAVLAGMLPYLRLRYAYAHKKVKGSYHLLDVVKIAAKFTHLPVDALLGRTADYLDEDNVLVTPLKILAASFANYSSEHELAAETQRFANAVSTTFAVEFVSDLLYCEKEGGYYLKNSLMMLNRSMEQQRETILEVKANSRDAISLGLYGNLVVLFFSIGTFIYMLKPGVYFRLQFETRAGLAFLMVIVSGLFLSFVISSVLAKPKLDYH